MFLSGSKLPGDRAEASFISEARNPPTVEPSTETEARARIRNLVRIRYYVRDEGEEAVQIEVTDLLGTRLHGSKLARETGIGEYRWNLKLDATEGERPGRSSQAPEFAGPGQYLVTLTVGDCLQTRVLSLNKDPITETR